MISYVPYSAMTGKIAEEHFMVFVTSMIKCHTHCSVLLAMFPSQLWFLGGGREASFDECPLYEQDTK